MKNPKRFLPKPLALLLAGVIILLHASCQEEDLKRQDQVKSDSEENFEERKLSENARFGRGICFTIVDPGRLVFGPLSITCENNWGACNRYYQECLPWLDPCALIPCGIDWIDPWIIYEKFRFEPEIFESFRDAGQIQIDPATTSAYFPVNANVLGIQFYEEWEHSVFKNKLHLRTSIVLDEETMGDYELEGNVLPAGIYPVIYNEKNHTFNAFASVNKFPVKYDRSINQIIPGYFDGSLNSIFKDFDLKEHPESALIEEDLEKFVVEPNLSENLEGVYIFSSNFYDLNLIFKGDPTPQPNKFDPTPTPVKIWIEEEIWLNEEIAKLLKIEPFLIKPENVFQAYDEEQGVLRVTILR